MPSLDRFDPWTIGLVVLGVALLATGLLQLPAATSTEHYTEVTNAQESNVGPSDTVYRFENLSADGKAIFLDAEDTGEAIFTEPEKKPPEFTYYDDVSRYVYVRYEGALYGVRTSKEDCLGLFCLVPLLRAGLFAVAGVVSVGFGWMRHRRRRLSGD